MANFWLCLSVILFSSVLFSSADSLVGDSEKIDSSLPDVQTVASYAVNLFNEKSEYEFLFKVVKVIAKETKVIAGKIYNLDVEIGKTQCKKGSTGNVASCALVDTSEQRVTFQCKFYVLEQAWHNEISVLESSCKPARLLTIY
ncbi:cystatin-like [Microcaecilia unicolor]|uniref:Cystatin-like n=1 Tax=Microcaecilia unicolor TaxID=1415580 RepID=A0A6P7XI43_9AMPH|nr:cystatin-like [Microcaecilia unicolor]